MNNKISLTFYSDVLCIWAHIAQARVDEIKQHYPEQVEVDYRFCSVFGDSAFKIAVGWADRGAYAGFAKHLQEAVNDFDHIILHPEIWQLSRPHSSTPAHLILKAVQRIDASQCESVMCEIRRAFFERCLDISSREVLQGILQDCGVATAQVAKLIDSGQAHADLEADNRDKTSLMVQGSPTIILNDGRQKLYGNVGYGVIESNIKELLRSPVSGSASWC
jgi:predicted DsbA family dithiol-disulfide isomerase